MEPKNKYILPLLGLFTPLVFYFIVGSIIAPYVTAFNVSNDILLIILGLCYLILISYSHHEGKSQNKFFKRSQKRYQESDSNDGERDKLLEVSSKRYGTSFFINVYANLIAIYIWFFSSDGMIFGLSSAVGVENVWYSLVVLLILMFVCSTIFRVIASIILFRIKIGTTLNSIKFILLEEVIVYGIWSSIPLFYGGFFF
jgi:hypothetical protein